MIRRRPVPPQIALVDDGLDRFVAAPEVGEFISYAFLSEVSPLYNEDHSHLRQARVGYIWTNATNSTQQRPVAGKVMIPRPPQALSDKWQKAMWVAHMRQILGVDPGSLDFVMMLYAPYAASCDDVDLCALLDHECYHMSQEGKAAGVPQFVRSGSRKGRPKFALLGHDVEEFTGVVRRYGHGAGAGGTVDFVKAANRRPLIARSTVSRLCGTVADRRVA